jgi:hypothetical protein
VETVENGQSRTKVPQSHTSIAARVAGNPEWSQTDSQIDKHCIFSEIHAHRHFHFSLMEAREAL